MKTSELPTLVTAKLFLNQTVYRSTLTCGEKAAITESVLPGLIRARDPEIRQIVNSRRLHYAPKQGSPTHKDNLPTN